VLWHNRDYLLLWSGQTVSLLVAAGSVPFALRTSSRTASFRSRAVAAAVM
jgi:hypothetical protein